MKLTEREEIVQAVKRGLLFDFLGNEGHRLDRQNLIDLTKELTYAFARSVDSYNKSINFGFLIELLEQKWNMEDGKERE